MYAQFAHRNTKRVRSPRIRSGWAGLAGERCQTEGNVAKIIQISLLLMLSIDALSTSSSMFATLKGIRQHRFFLRPKT